MYEAVWLVERDLIQGEVVERLERDRVHRRLNLLDQLERLSVPVWSAAANFLSNPAAPLRQRPDAGPKQECKVCDFLGTETSSDSSHQGASLISTQPQVLSHYRRLFVLPPICQSWIFVL